MKPDRIANILPGVVLLVCVFVLVYWLSAGKGPQKADERLPVTEHVPMIAAQEPSSQAPEQSSEQLPSATESSGATGSAPTTTFAPGTSSPTQTVQAISQVPGSWNMFRGPNSDNISKENVPLASSWGSGKPRLIWSMPAGEGHAGFAVHNSRAYILDYDRDAQADVLRCLSYADGKQLWSYSYPVSLKRNHGMSRTVPAVNDKYVVSIGPKLQLICADALTGRLIWQKDLVKEYGSTVPPWYAGQCPLLDGNRVIIATAGPKVLITALDCATGKTLWQTPNTPGWTMTHSSVIPAKLLGVKMYLYCGSGGVAGFGASDGKLIWQTSEWRVRIANVPSPVPVPNDRVFLSGGYNAGSMMIQLTGNSKSMQVKTLFKLPASKFGSDQQTPILYNNYIYGVIPGGKLVCMDLNGKTIWDSDSDKFGLGPYVAAAGKLYVLADKGLLRLVALNPAGYKKLGQSQVLTGHDAWAPIAVAGGRMIMRDLTKVVCMDMR